MVERKTLSSQLCVLVLPIFLLISLSITTSGCGGRRNSAADSSIPGDPAAIAEQTSSGDESGVALADLATEEPPAPDLTDGPRDAFAQISGVPPQGAAGGPAYSSYYKTNMAFDGTPRTWWAGERNKATWDLYYGLPAAISLTKLTINFYSSQYTPTGVKLYTSSDGTTWTQSGNISNPTSKPSFTLANVSAKYIRIEMTGNPPTGIPIIREIDWLPAAYKPGASAGPNYNDDWYFAANAFDNNPGTWWAGKANAGAWDIYYNFGSPRQITLLSAAFYNTASRPANVTLYTSGDGLTWTKTGDLGPEATSTIYVGAAVLYMKLAMTGNPQSTFPLIKDIYFDATPGPASPDSYSAFYSANKAFDNKPATLWAGKKAATEWNIYYTFPAPTAVTNVAIHYTDAAHTPAASDLYTSGDGITWTNTATFSSGSEASAWAGVTVKYLRFKLTPAATATAAFFPTIKDIDIGGSTAAPSVQLNNSEGSVTPNVSTGDDVYFGMTGLVPGAMYDISVSYPNGASYTLNLSANEAGVIPSSSVLAYDAGLPLDPADPGTGRMANGMGGNMAGREALLLPGESIKVIVKKGAQTVTNFTVPYVTSGTKPNAYTSNSSGYLRNAFVCANNEDVYISFRQFTSGEKVRAYIVPDRIKWKLGDRINDISGGYESFTLPSSDRLFGSQYKIWTNSGGNCAPIGEYDIIIERGTLDGFLEDGDIVDSQVTVGFMIQGAPSSADIIEQIATDKDYTYKNIFSPSETVYVYMNPKVRSRVFESIMKNGFAMGMVLKYVTRHKAAWNAGDSILDQTSGIEGDMVQWGCYNESLVTVWPAPLTPGDYDIIIDANKNGIYDPGVDFLDNIDENGLPNYGFRVQAAAPPCAPQCVDDSKCEDGNQDTVNTCANAGTCRATCESYKKSCDLTVDKVNYIPEQTMQITLTGRNESSQDVKCGVEIALKRAKLNPVWNSFDDNIYITIPAGTEVVRNISKFIPSTWAGTDTRDGSDYAIYTVRDDKTRWDKGDNFNTHVKWECPITCLNATECDDHNAGNIDSCVNPGTCSSSCSHASCAIACNADSGCDDGNPLTTDACSAPGACAAACSHTACSVACNNDTQCNDGNATTFDTCDNMGTCAAACSHTVSCTPACSDNASCDDGNILTTDICVSAGSCDASCMNAGVQALLPSYTLTLASGQAQSTLTCSAFGTYTQLEGRCDSTKPWTAITSGFLTFTGGSMSCVYTARGSYLPGCRINNSITANASQTVNVSNALPVPSIAANPPNSASAPVTVNFTGTCADADGTCVSYTWDFGDGSPTTNTQNPTHTFNAVKAYFVTLTVTDNDGASAQATYMYWIGAAFNMSRLAAGWYHTCAMTPSGGIKCWGNGTYGQLGNGTTNINSAPTLVSNINSGALAFSGQGGHSCAIMSSGGLKCWGYNIYGQTSVSPSTSQINSPADVPGLTSGIAAVSIGSGYHTCVVTTGGGVKCWGYNYDGQLGDGTNTNKIIPTDVIGLSSGVAAISTGVYQTCALMAAGGVKCWGDNNYGQLGDGTYTDRLTPVNVIGLSSGVTAISAGLDHTCALTTAGGVKCWGYNGTGILGDGTFTNRLTPVDVVGLSSGVIAISTNWYHSCALMASGGVKCWGYNAYGQLGDGTSVNNNVPVNVTGLSSGVVEISAGYEHTCALMASGGIKCWGENYNGQLGDGTTTNRYTPVTVVGF